jgi:hypothetical protein
MYRCMSPRVISKIFYEFQNGSHSKFVRRIKEKRAKDNTLDKSIHISTRVSNNSSDIYINYTKGENRVMHCTIHMCPSNIYTPNAPFHMKQNASEVKRGIILRVFQDDTLPSKIRIELGTDIGEEVNAPYRQETQYIVDSLNDFFNEAVQPTSQQPLHTNSERVYENIQTALKKYNTKTQRHRL